MKTIPKHKSRFRYQKVNERHDHTARRLMDIMQISETDYYMHEFDNGMALLDTYFNDTPEADRLKHLLATVKQYRYWPWYRLGRREAEATFWNTYQYIYTDNVAYYDQDTAGEKLRKEWLLEMIAYNELPLTHERLRAHVLQSGVPI